jgi:flagellin-like hook-associated protein FlgL
MSGVNFNQEAARAVQALRLLSQESRQTEMRVITGLAVSSPRQNGAVFAIASGQTSRLASFVSIQDGMARAQALIDVTLAAGAAVSDILLRMKAAAGAARSNDLTAGQRGALQASYDALRSQIDQILAASQFNGANLSAAGGSDIDVVMSDHGSAGSLQQIRTANTIAQLGAPVRLSTDANGQQATGGQSASPIFMPDSRSVVFHSEATNLVASDTNGVRDTFLKDIATGAITRISVTGAGSQQTGASTTGVASVSGDGRLVLFNSEAANLVSGDTNGVSDIFIKDLATGAVSRVSTTATGAQANGASAQGSLSADGRLMVFQSFATDLVPGDTNGRSDLFLKDLETGAITRVSTGSGGEEATDHSYRPLLSPDGQTVLFESLASNLVPDDTNAASDIFLKNLQTGAVTRVSTPALYPETIGGASTQPSFSPDGRYVAFLSSATNLVSGDTNGAIDVFIKDLFTGAIQRVSTDAGGGQQNGNASNAAASVSFSPDGRFVTFASAASNLVPGDTNGLNDSFLKDLKTGEVTRLSTTAGGGQASGGENFLARFSPDGRSVVFRSGATNLVAGDTNAQDDVFLRDVTLTSTGVIPGLAAYIVGNAGVTAADDTQFRIDGTLIGTVDITPTMTIAEYLETVRTATGGRVTARYDTASGEFTYETTAISQGQGVLTLTSAGTARAWLGHGLVGSDNPSGEAAIITLPDQDWTVGGSGALSGISGASGQLLSSAGAALADAAIDSALIELSSQMSLLGSRAKAIAVQDRFNTALIANMQNNVSRLVDADLARESARLQSLEIRRQLASQALSIANQAPQMLLSLFARSGR